MEYQQSHVFQDEPWPAQVSAGRPTLIQGIGNWAGETGVQPPVVRGARAWFMVQAVLSALMIVPFAVISATPDSFNNPAPMVFALIITLIASVTTIRLIDRRAKSAWTWSLALAAFSLTSFPIGMAVGAYILSSWFKPETKAWFGKY
ncbi:MAG: hypothetical protein M3Y56_01290 [Armatimonadota bacterium]|nr:hypothetical protein [Armatimonadota bacterium]